MSPKSPRLKFAHLCHGDDDDVIYLLRLQRGFSESGPRSTYPSTELSMALGTMTIIPVLQRGRVCVRGSQTDRPDCVTPGGSGEQCGGRGGWTKWDSRREQERGCTAVHVGLRGLLQGTPRFPRGPLAGLRSGVRSSGILNDRTRLSTANTGQEGRGETRARGLRKPGAGAGPRGGFLKGEMRGVWWGEESRMIPGL